MMALTKNFSVEELSATDTGLFNLPDHDAQRSLLLLATYILQPTRDMFGPVRVNSGYRCELVNHKIGGAASSQHLDGEAADIVPEHADIETVFRWMVKNLHYGQIILEESNGARWIHVSLPRLDKPNQQAMIYQDGKYSLYTVA